MIGLDKNSVQVIPYCETWKEEFEKEKAILEKLLGAYSVQIEHVGSTALPGLSAKPIIDIAVGAKDEQTLFKLEKVMQKAGYDYHDEFISIADNLEYEKVAKLAARLRELYISKQVDQIDLLYHHFKNMVQQILTHKIYLPLSIQEETKSVDNTAYATDYILEPSVYELQQLLFPKMLDLQIYTTLLDTTTSEHAARMMAMQTANDNANELIRQLTLQYNKTRQQAITNELLDIMGGASQSS